MDLVENGCHGSFPCVVPSGKGSQKSIHGRRSNVVVTAKRVHVDAS
jgi:hypothetical protein